MLWSVVERVWLHKYTQRLPPNIEPNDAFYAIECVDPVAHEKTLTICIE